MLYGCSAYDLTSVLKAGIFVVKHTAEEKSSLRNHILNVYRRLLRFPRHVTACCDDNKRVCLAVQILDVKASKKDNGCCNNALSETELLP
jgi:hypothetical protein